VAPRFGALVIDSILMIGSFFLVSILAAAFSTRAADGSVTYSTAGSVILWTWVLFFLVYHPVCWWRFGHTAGQKAMGLRVVREVDGLPLRIGAVVLRYVIWFACMLTVILAIIAAIMADSEPAKRAWHDEASGSVVIRPL
jgi:uncharacterized RDD family membrane protein YckC